MKKNILLVTILLILTGIFTSCYTPNPLYGTWTDNSGNKIQFMDDGTFTATVFDMTNTAENYEGSWKCIDNVLIFNILSESSYTRNTEWDVRGSFLYLTWQINGTAKVLTLQKTAR